MKKDTDQNEIKKQPPFWHKLLIEWEKDKLKDNRQSIGKGQSGLTLPFIIGAQGILNLEKQINIKELFQKIKEYVEVNNDYLYRIRFCRNKTNDTEGMNEYVLYNVKERHTNTPKFGFSDTEGIREINQNDISDWINQYEPHILKNEFSKNGDKWGDYSKQDIDIISRAKK